MSFSRSLRQYGTKAVLVCAVVRGLIFKLLLWLQHILIQGHLVIPAHWPEPAMHGSLLCTRLSHVS